MTAAATRRRTVLPTRVHRCGRRTAAAYTSAKADTTSGFASTNVLGASMIGTS
ncbi:hypothetical protein BSP109_00960 [Brevibacterium sp. Mu109]|nr:hypothetical protein BSP109_00960 [Brevibacterium sp. Mu109]